MELAILLVELALLTIVFALVIAADRKSQREIDGVAIMKKLAEAKFKVELKRGRRYEERINRLTEELERRDRQIEELKKWERERDTETGRFV